MNYSKPNEWTIFVQRENRVFLCASIYDHKMRLKYMLGAKMSPPNSFVSNLRRGITLELNVFGDEVVRAYESAIPINVRELARARMFWEEAKATCVSDNLETESLSDETVGLIKIVDALFYLIEPGSD